MMRGIVIFTFFAMATVLVIILQPGPRPDYAYDRIQDPLHDATRNEVGVLTASQPAPVLQAPDDVISKLKAAAQPRRAQVPAEQPTGETSGALVGLQAALAASLGNGATANDATADFTKARQAAPQMQTRPQFTASTVQAVAPELRDMSWQTLNALNGLGHVAKAPGQEGSLLNSIVRRSMGQVGNAPLMQNNPQMAVQPRAFQAPVAAPAQQAVRRQAAANQSYIVAPGDTLALIAIKLYGSALATDRLLQDNPTLRQNPNALRIGQVLQYSLR